MMEMYKKPGQIVSKVRKMAVDHIKADMKIIDLVEYVENNIIEMGGMPAFPCNVSINEVTAHYTSPPGDDSTIKRGDLVKIDLGAHVEGYIADSAVSVLVGADDYTDLDSSEHDLNLKMIETAQNALESAINTIKDGIEIGKVGTAIEETINQNNLNSVSNLTGHSMDRWILHSGVSVPNIKEDNKHIIQEGDVLAIEPFVTNGIGRVGDMNDTYIFRFLRDRPMRMVQARKLLKIIEINYRTLPFSQRWLTEHINSKHLNMAMRQLLSSRAIYPYHVLKEKSNARVAQAEHTVIVESDGCKIITE
ncbi:type II methionyl aminopeptidase [Methanobacterium spitsbergense]|uniref:Methionine aminopeptidase n=1 Tax=Methanobacterium spitsbergense TaxID=2874285 RepID=A0A8T5UUR9_9EURY|nr:type II methionyl aminopeptidase [Methanobacterium spitsbergense]MBZ2164940.1 type II methionyl aminopeptidase [Methanobacterium spitsbergense]